MLLLKAAGIFPAAFFKNFLKKTRKIGSVNKKNQNILHEKGKI